MGTTGRTITSDGRNVFYILTMSKTAKAFGHDGGFAVGLIFLPPVFLLILALNEDRYLGYPLN